METSWAGGGVAMTTQSSMEDAATMTQTTTSTATNFTQAALLLQNSSGVYSRKVEYLHGLVYQALEHYSQGGSSMQTAHGNGNKKKTTRSATAVADADLDDFYAFDPHQDFLLLDDVLPLDLQGSKINLPLSQQITITAEEPHLEQPHQSQPRNSLSRFSLTTSTNTRNNNNNNNSLLLNHTKQHASGTSLSGSMAGLPSSQNSGGGSSHMGPLRLMDTACHVSEHNGLLLWPGLGPPPPAFANAATTAASAGDANHNDAVNDDNSVMMMMVNDDGNDDDDKEGDGFVMAGDDDNDNVPEQPSSPPAQQDHTAIINNASTVPPDNNNDPPAPPATTNTHWTLLDPYGVTTTTTMAKPQRPRKLKVGKTLRLPAGSSELPSQCVTGASTRRASNLLSQRAALPQRSAPSHRSYLLQAYRNDVTRKLLTNRQVQDDDDNDDAMDVEGNVEPKKTKLQTLLSATAGQSLPEFDYIKSRIAKVRTAQHRRELKHLGNNNTVQPRRLHLEPTTKDDQQHLDDGGDDDYAYGGDDYGNDHDDDGDDMAMRDGDGDDNAIYNNNAGVMSVLDALPHRAADTLSSSSTSSDPHRPPTFDELCRAHIQAFAKSAQRFATETKLTQRVGAWQAKLFPLLQEEERRPAFDIYNYSDQVLSAMQQELKDAANVNSKGGRSSMSPGPTEMTAVRNDDDKTLWAHSHSYRPHTPFYLLSVCCCC